MFDQTEEEQKSLLNTSVFNTDTSSGIIKQMLNTIDLSKTSCTFGGYLSDMLIKCQTCIQALASNVVPRLFADFDGVIVLPSKVTLKS